MRKLALVLSVFGFMAFAGVTSFAQEPGTQQNQTEKTEKTTETPTQNQTKSTKKTKKSKKSKKKSNEMAPSGESTGAPNE